MTQNLSNTRKAYPTNADHAKFGEVNPVRHDVK
jgi:hypothetical protein